MIKFIFTMLKSTLPILPSNADASIWGGCIDVVSIIFRSTEEIEKKIYKIRSTRNSVM